MIAKFLTLATILFILYVLFFKKKKQAPKEEKEIENFVQCLKCGTFVTTKSAILSSGQYICKDCIKGK
ncbi:PP0621 family protein [Campylobacter pinnipediorum]|uniref:PP0621 family protein n=1 Tax=Campylobacter pinnipediorum TaxID=1965231 RepID=UPI00084D06BB|nr:PP0621 family protein [Campylobacter pinnipediorum]